MAYSRSFLRHTSLLVLALAAAAACGDGTKPPPYIDPNTNVPNGDGDGDGDGDGTGGSRGDGDGDETAAAEPKIEISFEGGTPDLDDPAQDRISPVCSVTPGDDSEEAAIDRSTVKLLLLDADGEELQSLDGALVAGSEEDFSAEFLLENLPSGNYAVSCSASTVGKAPTTAQSTEKFLVDAGPTIVFTTPEPNSALQPATPQRFNFTVVPSLLSENDSGAAIDSVKVSVKGQVFDAALRPSSSDEYSVEINFADTALFPDLPNGEILLTVEATNSRGENSRTSAVTAVYDLDGQGPVITLTSPKDTSIIGGTVQLQFTITDDFSGFDPDSITVKLNDKVFTHNDVDGRWLIEKTKVTFQFESAEVLGSKVQTNVEIAARDKAGNDATIRTATLFRDEQAPIVSLTPPPFRSLKTVSNADYCSRAFDPIGDAVRGGVVPETVLLRAIAWDETNTSEGQQVVYLSGVNKTSVELWVRKATDGPLIEDTNGDNTCDDIITDDTLSKSKQLEAINATGKAHYSLGDEGAVPLIDGICALRDEIAPDPLCGAIPSDLTVVAHHRSGKAESIVYGIPAPAAECTGGRWELPSAIPNYEGWVCVAARAYDNAGNRGVSKPIAVCLNKPGVGDDPACLSELASPPNCMSSCTAPKDFSATGIIYKE